LSSLTSSKYCLNTRVTSSKPLANLRIFLCTQNHSSSKTDVVRLTKLRRCVMQIAELRAQLDAGHRITTTSPKDSATAAVVRRTSSSVDLRVPVMVSDLARHTTADDRHRLPSPVRPTTSLTKSLGFHGDVRTSSLQPSLHLTATQ